MGREELNELSNMGNQLSGCCGIKNKYVLEWINYKMWGSCDM